MVVGQGGMEQGAKEHDKEMGAREGDMELMEHVEHDFAFSTHDILISIKHFFHYNRIYSKLHRELIFSLL